ncbi:MAG: hypothetical protein ABMA01_24185 [Chthoniobacteraceae bacterium]
MKQPIAKGCLAATVLAAITVATAGETVVPRRTFRESGTYPRIFRPEGYLATGGPIPMRIEQKPAAFSKRLAPPLPAAAKGTEKPVPPKPAAQEEPPDAAPENETHTVGKKDELPLPQPDLGRTPDAVLGFFRDKDGGNNPQRGTRLFLFDPIFQPARPSELPRSKATYIQKP